MATTRTHASAELTVKTVNPLVEAVQETFDSMLGASIHRTGLDMRPENASMYDISALIGVSGRVSGAFCISFAFETAAGAVSRFTGLDVDPRSALVADGVGEFTNVIIGSAKEKFDIALNLGIPNVVLGKDHHVTFPAQARPIRVTFESDFGPMMIDFGFSCSDIY